MTWPETQAEVNERKRHADKAMDAWLALGDAQAHRANHPEDFLPANSMNPSSHGMLPYRS